MGNTLKHLSGAGEVFIHTFPAPEKCLYIYTYLAPERPGKPEKSEKLEKSEQYLYTPEIDIYIHPFEINKIT